ncbi:MAG: NifU family protein [Candidatus Berkiellales bacterium]
MTAVTAPNIHVTQDAQEHFSYLIEKEEMPGMALRIFIDQPGSRLADVSISFCPPGEHRAGDIPLEFTGFTLYVERASISYLENAQIDYKKDNLSGQLSITAPNLRGAKPESDADLVEKVNYLLDTEINPNLASHGGKVSLVEITPNNEVVLRFGGGCHGCGMVDVTLKQGIEKALLSQIPELTAVMDVTDHSKGENPYYA